MARREIFTKWVAFRFAELLLGASKWELLFCYGLTPGKTGKIGKNGKEIPVFLVFSMFFP